MKNFQTQTGYFKIDFYEAGNLKSVSKLKSRLLTTSVRLSSIVLRCVVLDLYLTNSLEQVLCKLREMILSTWPGRKCNVTDGHFLNKLKPPGRYCRAERSNYHYVAPPKRQIVSHEGNNPQMLNLHFVRSESKAGSSEKVKDVYKY